MMDLLVELRLGGVWMIPVAALLLVGVVLTLVFGLLTALKLKVPSILWLAAPTAIVGVSTFGMYWGLVETQRALGVAPVEFLDAMGAGGVRVSLLVPVAGGLSLVCLGVLIVWAAGIGGVIASFGAPARTDVRGALVGGIGPLVLAAVVGLAAMGLGLITSPPAWVFGGTLLCSAIGLAFAAARVPLPVDVDAEPDLDPRIAKKRGRSVGAVISARGAAWLGLVTATAGAAWFALSAELSMTYEAVSHAPAEMQSALESSGYAMALTGTVLGIIAILGSTLIGLGLMALVGKQALVGSRLILGALAGIPAVVWLGCVIYTASAPGPILGSIDVTPVDFAALVKQVGDPPTLAQVGPSTTSGRRSSAATWQGGEWVSHKATRTNAPDIELEPVHIMKSFSMEDRLFIVRGSMKAQAFLNSDGLVGGLPSWVRIPASDTEDWPHAAVSVRVKGTAHINERPFGVLMSDTELYLWERDKWVSAPMAQERGRLAVAVGPDVTMNGLLTLCSFSSRCTAVNANLDAVVSEFGGSLPNSASSGEAP